MTTFCETLRLDADHLWRQSFEHPFVRGIADGSLPVQRFAHYVLNDSYYLSVFAKVQSLAAAKAPDLATAGRLAHHAAMTAEAEHQLHETFFGMLGVQRGPDFVPAPAAYRYATHLLAVAAEGDFGEILAAILPCYWLYWEIGERLKDAQPNHPIYDKWIRTYGDEWYGELVREQIERLNACADTSDDAARTRMRRHFLISSQYELEFWNIGWTLEGWPFDA
ncbi:MAG: thiaminase II [Thermoflavifilum sp.]|nr:thiaminase II [Thermoflavifilum sp.]MCL6512972.1 thiaminase II [Alicyclobacillus sp.]